MLLKLIVPFITLKRIPLSRPCTACMASRQRQWLPRARNIVGGFLTGFLRSIYSGDDGTPPMILSLHLAFGLYRKSAEDGKKGRIMAVSSR